MVRLSDLQKYRAQGSRTNTTWLGEELRRRHPGFLDNASRGLL
ncbi:hypothetical protein ACNKHV_27655 [Shigella flexneri]